MSANMVGDTHIHLLINAGLSLPTRGSKLRWQVRELSVQEKERAYSAGQPWGPEAHEMYGKVVRELTRANAGYVGAMLLAENRRSVDHRYAEEEWEQPYLFQSLPGVPNPVAVLKALDGFEYQACEHPEWETSEAFNFCDSLRRTAIKKLPGYEDAPWEVLPSNLLSTYRWPPR
ncbi:hypothetical protein [Streptomyces sp. NPDC002088]|uniref:hypothetical protein n=1 Tax=Streptomyces sp. NPDC002088 TaxID=3154665 RepID=UPI0033165CD2